MATPILHNKRFAGFIMTYERPEILVNTITALLEQTCPPEKILVIDNSESDRTGRLMAQYHHPVVGYHRMGYNAGPAGAAKYGLSKLTQEGFDWIYWGDDDDPPKFKDSFQQLFEKVQQPGCDNVGVMGTVGHYFNAVSGNFRRTEDYELNRQDTIFIDSIAGGHCMIVNSKVIKAGVLPDEKFFFGFEELDFCLSVKRTGFQLMVPTEIFKRTRTLNKKQYEKRPFYVQRDRGQLKRQYYSIRNILFILKKNGHASAYLYQLLKAMMKIFYGFKAGPSYGFLNAKMISTALFHAVSNRGGKYY